MATKGKGSNTGTVFFKAVDGKFGTYYEGQFTGVGAVQAEINDDQDLVLKIGTKTDMLKPKTNQYGPYYIATIGDSRYFVSERSNSKGKYMMAKVAPERPVSEDGRTQRPAAYGTKRS